MPAAGYKVTGRVSWFGGPRDSSDSGQTALGRGMTTATPGIAIYNRATLGGYWRVTAPNGKTQVVRQTDLGPAPWTGKKIDFTYSALKAFGYTEGNFPTGATATATYLGKNPSQAALTAAVANAGSGGATKYGTGAPATTAAATGGSTGGPLFDSAIANTAMQILLTTGLVGTGAVLLFLGLTRAVGVRNPLGLIPQNKLAGVST